MFSRLVVGCVLFFYCFGIVAQDKTRTVAEVQKELIVAREKVDALEREWAKIAPAKIVEFQEKVPEVGQVFWFELKTVPVILRVDTILSDTQVLVSTSARVFPSHYILTMPTAKLVDGLFVEYARETSWKIVGRSKLGGATYFVLEPLKLTK